QRCPEPMAEKEVQRGKDQCRGPDEAAKTHRRAGRPTVVQENARRGEAPDEDRHSGAESDQSQGASGSRADGIVEVLQPDTIQARHPPSGPPQVSRNRGQENAGIKETSGLNTLLQQQTDSPPDRRRKPFYES